MWYEPDSTLASLLETMISEYESDRERYWSDDEQTTRLREFIDDVASVIVSSSDDLVLKVSGKLTHETWEGARQLVEALELSSEVRAKAEILVAWRFATDTDAMAGRCIELAEVLLREHPSERVLRFMRRLGRCYIAGLLPEAIIMCRGVLESGVDEAVQSMQLPTDGKMRTKLDQLVSTGRLSQKGRDSAWTVWQRGNTAIHKDPEAVGQALETITMVVAVLGELQR